MNGIDLFRQFVQDHRDSLKPVAHLGDGKAGCLVQVLMEELVDPVFLKSAYKKKAISQALAKQVFERDAYRCVACSSYVDLTCDHLIPESLGGETALNNLQTMCRRCNSSKGTS